MMLVSPMRLISNTPTVDYHRFTVNVAALNCLAKSPYFFITLKNHLL